MIDTIRGYNDYSEAPNVNEEDCLQDGVRMQVYLFCGVCLREIRTMREADSLAK